MPLLPGTSALTNRTSPLLSDRRALLTLLGLLAVAPLACTRTPGTLDRAGERADTQTAPTAEVILEPASGAPPSRVRVELARTPDEHARGLMHRRSLADGAGMLFLFDREEPRRFWMRNCYISLDMLFFDRQLRLVGVEENTIPHDETARGPDTPAQYVLEVPGGYSRRHGIGPGSRATFVGLP